MARPRVLIASVEFLSSTNVVRNQTIWNVSNKVKDTILNCGLTSGNRAPIVNIDECQVLWCTIDVIEKTFPRWLTMYLAGQTSESPTGAICGDGFLLPCPLST